MTNYYEVLGIEPNCSQNEVKTSFRKRAKEIHPDIQGLYSNSHDKMRLLIKAYETLSDPQKRHEYDKKITYKKEDFNYRDFLYRKKNDPSIKCRLIFYDLLNNSSDEAIELYEALGVIGNVHLEQYLGREDFMDCIFLLSEEYDKRSKYKKAYSLLRLLVFYEIEHPYFKHFFAEIVDRMRALACFKMQSILGQDDIIRYLEDMASFNFSNKDTAFLYKKIAEIYADREQFDKARIYLEKGLELDKNLAGVKKLKNKIGLRYAEHADNVV